MLWYQAYGFVALILVLLFGVYQKELGSYKWTHWGIFACIVFCGILRSLAVSTNYEQEKHFFEEMSYVAGEGTVVSIDKNETGISYFIRYWKVEGKQSDRSKIRLISKNLENPVEIGDRVYFIGAPLPMSPLRNEGGFDFIRYNKVKNISLVFMGKLEKISTSKNLNLVIKKYLYTLREAHALKIECLLNKEEAGIIKALLLGLNTLKEEEIIGFRKAGLIHLLAISGLHVSIIGLLFFFLMKKVLGDQVGALVSLILIMLYCVYTGLHISTVRATGMLLIYLGRYMVVRKYDQASALATVLLCLLIQDPFYLEDIGFLLSFAAVASIFYIEPAVKRILVGETDLIRSIRLIIAIQIGLFPMLAYYFYKVPMYGLLANLLVLPIIPLLIVLAILMILLSGISMSVGLFFAGGVHFLLIYWLEVVHWVTLLPFNVLLVGRPKSIIIIFYVLILFLWIFKVKRRWLMTFIGIFIGMILMTRGIDESKVTVRFMDVGQGDCTIISCQKHYIMIDGGGDVKKEGEENVGKKVLLPFFEQKGVRKIHTVFVTHSDYDHLYGIIELAEVMSIGQIILPITYKDTTDKWLDTLRQVAYNKKIPIKYMEKGDCLKIGKLQIECLGPKREAIIYNNNSHSLLLYIHYKEFDGLFLGDTGKIEERRLISYVKEIPTKLEILKVAHHGSKSSSDALFLEAAMPQIGIVFAGEKNPYGHPHKEVIERLEKYMKAVYVTKNQGEIIIRTDGTTTKISSMLGR